MAIVTLPYPPSVNKLYATVAGRRVLSEAGRSYKATAAIEASRQGMRPITKGDVAVKVEVYRPRRAGDLDNRLKALLDSLKGIAFTDDEQVADIHARRFDDKANPRVVVQVLRLDD